MDVPIANPGGLSATQEASLRSTFVQATASDSLSALSGRGQDSEDQSPDSRVTTPATQEDKEAARAEIARQEREARLAYLRVYIETNGAPEEKEQQAAPPEKDEEDEDERLKRGSKQATVYQDPEEPGEVKVAVYSYDPATRKMKLTRTHSVDTGEVSDRGKQGTQGTENQSRVDGVEERGGYAPGSMDAMV